MQFLSFVTAVKVPKVLSFQKRILKFFWGNRHLGKKVSKVKSELELRFALKLKAIAFWKRLKLKFKFKAYLKNSFYTSRIFSFQRKIPNPYCFIKRLIDDLQPESI